MEDQAQGPTWERTRTSRRARSTTTAWSRRFGTSS